MVVAFHTLAERLTGSPLNQVAPIAAWGAVALSSLRCYRGLLTLWMAVISDMGATVLVILNALRLLSPKPESANGHPRYDEPPNMDPGEMRQFITIDNSYRISHD